MDEEKRYVRPFKINAIEPSCTWIVLGPPGAGKTSFVEDLIKYNQHNFPVCHVSSNVPSTYEKFLLKFPGLFVKSNFNLKDEEEVVKRQKKMSPKETQGKHCVYLLDDIKDVHLKGKDNTEFFAEMYKRGSRHWNMLTIFSNQSLMCIPCAMRENTTYVAIFDFPIKSTREKIYKHYGGARLFHSEKDFNDLMDELTKNQGCMIVRIVTRAGSNEDDGKVVLEDGTVVKAEVNVFYYNTRVKEHTDWKFNRKFDGLWRYNSERLDPEKNVYKDDDD